MRRQATWCVLASCLLLAACGGEAPPRSDDGGEAGAPPEGAEGAAAAGEAGTAADSARLLTDRLMEWQGGQDAWDATRFLRFDWIVSRGGETAARRSHAWDRRTGDYRVSFRRQDGARVTALFDVEAASGDDAPPGRAWVDGDRLEGTARDSVLRSAYRAFINDSYWLLMPLKWRDPGVHLEYAGWTPLPDGEEYPAVHLTFDAGVGITDDQYWGYLDPETGRMVAWRFHLQGREEAGPVIWWRDWRTFGPQGLKLSLDRRWEDGSMRIHFEEVEADTAPPADAFAPPAE